MGTSSSLTSHFCLPKHHTNHPPLFVLPVKTTSHLRHPENPFSQIIRIPPQPKQTRAYKTPIIQQTDSRKGSLLLPRSLILGAVSIGFMMFLLGADDHKALAFGPEGPLVEEFWDNMRRYGLYILTVSTGVASAILEPIIELLRNPITAVLVLVIFGGSFYIVSQVLSAMVGVSEFNYEYGY